jgi:biopolymer transport protein ExbD
VAMTWRPAALAALLFSGCSDAECEGPDPTWTQPDHRSPGLNVVRLKTSGEISWNAQPIDRAKLEDYLRRSVDFSPRPLVLLRADAGTACERVEELRATITRLYDCPAACAEGRRWDFVAPTGQSTGI